MTVANSQETMPAKAPLSENVTWLLSRMTALATLIVALSFASPYFFQTGNFVNILKQASFQFLMSSGLTIVVLTAGIDLSIGAVLGLAACVGASFLANGQIFYGVGSALLVGFTCGLVNGSLIAYLRIPSFIATYGMLWIAVGLSFVFMDGQVIYGFPESFRVMGSGFIGPIPTPILIAAILLIIMVITLNHTKLGRTLYAIGGNRNAARLSGMPVKFWEMMAYGISGLLAGFAGLVIIARTGAVDAGVGNDLLLPTIAAVVLGGTSLMGGRGGIVGTAIGALILAIILNGMNLLGVDTYWQIGVLGSVTVLAVLADDKISKHIDMRG
ncbi:ABC transporter permease [Lentibacter algarum]|uniref:ABC transporter permease n=1 Tax=Lentibacter algarum TaxID=576131 RepID=UPI001C070856|nr:ABC transporter permease [Lentibacter algarum]MBU2980195.1 ABC transporter permease [Lentibacter algarum]